MDKKLDMALDELVDSKGQRRREGSRSPYRDRDRRESGGKGGGKGKRRSRIAPEDKALLNTRCSFNEEGDLIIRLYDTEVVVLKDRLAASETKQADNADSTSPEAAKPKEDTVDKAGDDEMKAEVDEKAKTEGDGKPKPEEEDEKKGEADGEMQPVVSDEKKADEQAAEPAEAKPTDSEMTKPAGSEEEKPADSEMPKAAEVGEAKPAEGDAAAAPDAGEAKPADGSEAKPADADGEAKAADGEDKMADAQPEATKADAEASNCRQAEEKKETAASGRVVILNSGKFRTIETRYVINEALSPLSIHVYEEKDSHQTWTVSGDAVSEEKPFEDRMELPLKPEQAHASAVKQHMEGKIDRAKDRDRHAPRRRGDYDPASRGPAPYPHAWRPGMPPVHHWPPPPGWHGHPPPGWGGPPHHGAPAHHGYGGPHRPPYSGSPGPGPPARPKGPLPDSMFQ